MFRSKYFLILAAFLIFVWAVGFFIYADIIRSQKIADSRRSTEVVVKKESPFKCLTGGYYTEPTVFQYTQDGKTYLVFRAPEAIAVIEHKTP